MSWELPATQANRLPTAAVTSPRYRKTNFRSSLATTGKGNVPIRSSSPPRRSPSQGHSPHYPCLARQPPPNFARTRRRIAPGVCPHQETSPPIIVFIDDPLCASLTIQKGQRPMPSRVSTLVSKSSLTMIGRPGYTEPSMSSYKSKAAAFEG